MFSNWSGPQKAFLITVISFFILYFGFSKVAPEIRNPEKSVISTTIDNDLSQIARAQMDSLGEDAKGQIALYMQQLENAVNDTAKIKLLQQISGFWYQQNQVGLSADYAQEVAKMSNTADAWTIAATNYILALKQSNGSENDKNRWIANARAGFDEAIKLDSTSVIHKLNKALIMVEYPENGPMEGILALRDLNAKYPDEPTVLYHLARLAIETNQLDRAQERLDHLLKVAPDYSRAYCLLAKIAESKNDLKSLALYKSKCEE